MPPDERVHPYLSPAATVHNRWLGREVFHAGAFAAAGRAWLAVGPRTAGKSSLLAGLAARGVPVLADDIAVCSGAQVFSGPRCVDLREPVPGVDDAVTSSRGGLRRRIQLPPAPFQLPLGGWLFLGWAPEIEFQAISPRALLGMLARRRLQRTLPSDPRLLLSLAAHPAWHVRRPRDWAHADAVRAALLDLVTSAPLSA